MSKRLDKLFEILDEGRGTIFRGMSFIQKERSGIETRVDRAIGKYVKKHGLDSSDLNQELVQELLGVVRERVVSNFEEAVDEGSNKLKEALDSLDQGESLLL